MSSPISPVPTFDHATATQYSNNADIDYAVQAPEQNCDKSEQLLNKTNSHSDGNFVFLLFVFVVLAYTASKEKVLFSRTEPIPNCKNRLHVTYCIFQE